MAKRTKRQTKRTSYASMTMDALFNLRDEITGAIESRAADLRRQLARLTSDTSKRDRPAGRKSRMAGKKVAAQFRSKRDPSLTWSGRGANPRWMKDEMKGTKLKKEDFRIK